jgi:hypothetical protein
MASCMRRSCLEDGDRLQESCAWSASFFGALRCPADRRTGRMQRNVNGQLLGFGIEVSRGEITRCEIAASLGTYSLIWSSADGVVKSSKSSPPRTMRSILGVTCHFCCTSSVLRRELCLTRCVRCSIFLSPGRSTYGGGPPDWTS